MIKKLLITSAMAMTLSGCATIMLGAMEAEKVPVKQLLIEDKVVAFARPAENAKVAGNVVIVGENYSYVLTEGGQKLTQLITTLSPNHFSVTDNLHFDMVDKSSFKGSFWLAYKLSKTTPEKEQLDILKKHGAKPCPAKYSILGQNETTQATRYCLFVSIEGDIHPKINNFDAISAQTNSLTRPYKVKLYETTSYRRSRADIAERLFLLPLTLAFDVVTLPIQVVGLGAAGAAAALGR